MARTDGYRLIPGLVDHVSGEPDPMPYDPDEWRAWYGRMLVHRLLVKQQCAQTGSKGAAARQIHKALCAKPGGDGMLYWLITFCWIMEPRGEGDEAVMPFIPYPRQVELIDEINAAMASPKGAESSLAVEKARSVGATWIDAADHVWRWSFEPYYTGLLISRVEADVDNPEDAGSWMWKMDFLLGRYMRQLGNDYPQFLLPAGFHWDRAAGKQRRFLQLTNPETNSTIVGAATTENAGRSKRVRKASVDEGAFNEHFGIIWNLLNSTTDHRFVYSSAGVSPPDFYDLVRGKNGYRKPRTFRFEWHHIPGRDKQWLENERAGMNEADFRREVLIDYTAGSGVDVYPYAKRIELVSAPFEQGRGPLYVTIDDGLRDHTAIALLQRESGSQWVRVFAGYQNAGKPLAFYGSLLCGELTNQFSRDYTRADRDFADLCKKARIKDFATFYGDKHGDNKSFETGRSPFEALYEDFGIWVNTNVIPEENSYEFRKDALTDLLPWLKFDFKNGAADVLEAIQGYHYPKERPNATAEQGTPVHDANSHLVTAIEFFAIHQPAKQRAAAQPKVLPRNVMADAPKAPPVGRFKNRHVVGAVR